MNKIGGATMHFGAIFNDVKRSNLRNWTEFYSSLVSTNASFVMRGYVIYNIYQPTEYNII